VQSTVDRGPVRLTVQVEPAAARLSDELRLSITLDAAQGVTLRKPLFGQALGDFTIRDFHEPLPEERGDRQIVRQVYTLEPTKAGTLRVQPIVVGFSDTGGGKTSPEQTLESEPLTVEIATANLGEFPSLDQLRPAAEPLALPAAPLYRRWWPWAVAAAAVLAVVWAIVRRRRRRAVAALPQLSPAEQARRELEELSAAGLATRDVKLFYVALTGIVRRFIERTTGIHAPEQTTQEFLREIGPGARFSAAAAQRLQGFLESADLVKFAGHEPRPEDVTASFARAGEFIAGGLDMAAEVGP